jgi:hypothetical protein
LVVHLLLQALVCSLQEELLSSRAANSSLLTQLHTVTLTARAAQAENAALRAEASNLRAALAVAKSTGSTAAAAAARGAVGGGVPLPGDVTNVSNGRQLAAGNAAGNATAAAAARLDPEAADLTDSVLMMQGRYAPGLTAGLASSRGFMPGPVLAHNSWRAVVRQQQQQASASVRSARGFADLAQQQQQQQQQQYQQMQQQQHAMEQLWLRRLSMSGGTITAADDDAELARCDAAAVAAAMGRLRSDGSSSRMARPPDAPPAAAAAAAQRAAFEHRARRLSEQGIYTSSNAAAAAVAGVDQQNVLLPVLPLDHTGVGSSSAAAAAAAGPAGFDTNRPGKASTEQLFQQYLKEAEAAQAACAPASAPAAAAVAVGNGDGGSSIAAPAAVGALQGPSSLYGTVAEASRQSVQQQQQEQQQQQLPATAEHNVTAAAIAAREAQVVARLQLEQLQQLQLTCNSSHDSFPGQTNAAHPANLAPEAMSKIDVFAAAAAADTRPHSSARSQAELSSLRHTRPLQQQLPPQQMQLASAGIAASLASGAWPQLPQPLQLPHEQQQQPLQLTQQHPFDVVQTSGLQQQEYAAPIAGSIQQQQQQHMQEVLYLQQQRQQVLLHQQQLYPVGVSATGHAVAAHYNPQQQQQIGGTQLLASCLATSHGAAVLDSPEEVQMEYGPC